MKILVTAWGVLRTPQRPSTALCHNGGVSEIKVSTSTEKKKVGDPMAINFC
jgi:hypothetical protein